AGGRELQSRSLAEGQEFIAAGLSAGGGSGAGHRRPFEGASVRRLWEAAGGNPLYLREVVLGALDGGSFVLDGGLWRLVGRAPAPPRLVELVTSRLEGLADASRHLLEHLAVADALGLTLLEGIAGGAAVREGTRPDFSH